MLALVAGRNAVQPVQRVREDGTLPTRALNHQEGTARRDMATTGNPKIPRILCFLRTRPGGE